MKNILNLNGDIELVKPNSLANDGKIIDDKRDFGDIKWNWKTLMQL